MQSKHGNNEGYWYMGIPIQHNDRKALELLNFTDK